jgi:catechol 2,3-dioxygenase-like lactoylglutathione lyase family enzyme
VFHHVTLRASDRAASERFYDAVLPTIGWDKGSRGADRADWLDFWLVQATSEAPITRRLHIGFVAPSRDHVDEFWRAGTRAGYADDGAPGPRPEYSPDYYGAFLLDPDGNSAEAVHHGRLRRGGAIDHLWIRVADLAATKRFYETIGPRAGFELRRDLPERAGFSGGNGSFSVLAGTPTENAHLAFPTGEAESDVALDPDGNVVELVAPS